MADKLNTAYATVSRAYAIANEVMSNGGGGGDVEHANTANYAITANTANTANYAATANVSNLAQSAASAQNANYAVLAASANYASEAGYANEAATANVANYANSGGDCGRGGATTWAQIGLFGLQSKDSTREYYTENDSILFNTSNFLHDKILDTLKAIYGEYSEKDYSFIIAMFGNAGTGYITYTVPHGCEEGGWQVQSDSEIQVDAINLGAVIPLMVDVLNDDGDGVHFIFPVTLADLGDYVSVL